MKGFEFPALKKEIIHCQRCLRLRQYCKKIAAEKRRAFQDQDYWGKPVPFWGSSQAELVIVGLAPAAHGANRTGRMFTGDRSGDWLYRALFKAGFANQPQSQRLKDGLELFNTYITAAVKCAPPDNKPTTKELKTCISHYLQQEIEHLTQAKVYIALGQVAFQALWPLLSLPKEKRPIFQHHTVHPLQSSRKHLILSYHPSQQNTFTGLLTEPMFDKVFSTAKKLLES